MQRALRRATYGQDVTANRVEVVGTRSVVARPLDRVRVEISGPTRASETLRVESSADLTAAAASLSRSAGGGPQSVRLVLGAPSVVDPEALERRARMLGLAVGALGAITAFVIAFIVLVLQNAS